MTKTYKYVVFDVSGGIGKHIAATAVISNVKAAYPDSKLIVVAAWPRVFNNHPDIWRTYGNGEVRYFHDEYIKDKDFLFFKSEPYHHTDYIKKERHLIDVWTEQCGVPLIHTTPKIYLTTAEEKTFKHKYQSNRPLLLLQSNGGTNLPFPYSWVRDMPPDFTINLVNILKQHFQILHLRNNNHPQYGDGVTNITVEDIKEIDYLDFNAATLRFGTGHSGGIILVISKRDLSPLKPDTTKVNY